MDVNDAVGKFNEIQIEILGIGWSGVLKKYHPDINIDHKDPHKVFELYKEIYHSMRKRLIIDKPSQKQINPPNENEGESDE